MDLLVVGGGGREHAIIKKLKENPVVETIYALPGNGGIAADAVCVPQISATDIGAIVDFAVSHAVGFAVVAPGRSSGSGVCGRPHAAGIPCFGAGRQDRPDRVQQGLCQGPDEKISHPHRPI